MQIKSIDPVSLRKRLDEGSAVLIDVREAHEQRASTSKARGLYRYLASRLRISASFAS